MSSTCYWFVAATLFLARREPLSVEAAVLAGMRSEKRIKLLIANRGEIACRVLRSCRALAVEPVVVYTQADALSKHVLDATRTYCIGSSPREYTNAAKLIDIARKEG